MFLVNFLLKEANYSLSLFLAGIFFPPQIVLDPSFSDFTTDQTIRHTMANDHNPCCIWASDLHINHAEFLFFDSNGNS